MSLVRRSPLWNSRCLPSRDATKGIHSVAENAMSCGTTNYKRLAGNDLRQRAAKLAPTKGKNPRAPDTFVRASPPRSAQNTGVKSGRRIAIRNQQPTVFRLYASRAPSTRLGRRGGSVAPSTPRAPSQDPRGIPHRPVTRYQRPVPLMRFPSCRRVVVVNSSWRRDSSAFPGAATAKPPALE